MPRASREVAFDVGEERAHHLGAGWIVGGSPVSPSQKYHRGILLLAMWGSKTFAKCLGKLYRRCWQTEIGRSMTEMNASLLARIPNSPSILFDRDLKQPFATYAGNGGLCEIYSHCSYVNPWPEPRKTTCSRRSSTLRFPHG